MLTTTDVRHVSRGAPGTAPLPILLAHLNAQPFANAGNAALYTGTDWTAAAFLALLAQRNPNPYGFANVVLHGQRQHNRTDRQRDLPGQRDHRRRAAQLLRCEP